MSTSEMEASAFGQPWAKYEKYQERQAAQAEKPAPAERGHDENGQDHFEACARRPEDIAQDEAFGAVLAGQELGE